MAVTWQRSVLAKLDGIYCMEPFQTESGFKIAIASEIHDGACKLIDFDSRQEELVWSGPGGCMNIAQLDSAPTLVGVQNFYQGGQALDARVVRAQKRNGTWHTEVLAALPYLHHCGVVHAHDTTYVVACTLCTHREFKGDWSHPGCVHIISLLEQGKAATVQIIRNDVTKNHGFWQGMFDGEAVTMISGTALYRIRPPQEKGAPWRSDILLDREISDLAVLDFDGDGEDEILTIEGLHGNTAAINKRVNGEWKIVYTLPLTFAHAIWGGYLLGKPSFVVGSMEGNGELQLLQKTDEAGWRVEVTTLESGIAPTNCRGFQHNGKDYLIAAARRTGELVLFESS